MKKLKLILFKFFKKIHSLLIKSSFIRKIPGLSFFYDFFFQALWPYSEVLERISTDIPAVKFCDYIPRVD